MTIEKISRSLSYYFNPSCLWFSGVSFRTRTRPSRIQKSQIRIGLITMYKKKAEKARKLIKYMKQNLIDKFCNA